jgi:hypothetical protein
MICVHSLLWDHWESRDGAPCLSGVLCALGDAGPDILSSNRPTRSRPDSGGHPAHIPSAALNGVNPYQQAMRGGGRSMDWRRKLLLVYPYDW